MGNTPNSNNYIIGKKEGNYMWSSGKKFQYGLEREQKLMME
jgi:hypothetical protein